MGTTGTRHIDYLVEYISGLLTYRVTGNLEGRRVAYYCDEEWIDKVKEIIREQLCPKPLPILIGGELL